MAETTATAVVEPDAVVVIEPPRLLVGDVAAVDVVVVTPPGYRVKPIEPPEGLPGIWLLDSVAQPVQRGETRWTHRTRVRVRAREAGPVEWPPLRVQVEGPEGEQSTLETQPRPFEVVSVLGEFPLQRAPFSYRLPRGEAPSLSPWTAAAAGALAMLALVGAARVVRRRRARRAIPAEEAIAEAALGVPWIEAQRSLDAALEALDADWREAGHEGAIALRRYLKRRFGLPVESCTTEEAQALSPPFALARRWPRVLDVFRSIDALRFRSDAAAGAAGRAQLRSALREARQLVEETIPSEARR